MGTPQRRDSGGSSPSGRESSGATKYVVAPRRTVMVDKRPLSPGSPVDLSSEELERLASAGFVVAVEEESPAGAGIRVGGLQIKGGRRPGAKVA